MDLLVGVVVDVDEVEEVGVVVGLEDAVLLGAVARVWKIDKNFPHVPLAREAWTRFPLEM